MSIPAPRRLCSRSPLARVSAGLLCALLAACGGSDSGEATPEDVDRETPIAVTEEEMARFTAPGDSVLTEAQVEGYLKTSLLQFDLIRKESQELHERFARMEEREKEGGLLRQMQNLRDAGQTMVQVTELVGGSYIRSARTLDYNPAEMEWVRERMSEVSGYLAMKPMYEQAAGGAEQVRAQAEEMRRQAVAQGMDPAQVEEQVQQMLDMADEMEANARGEAAAGSVLRNLEVLRRARPAVTEEMWAGIGLAAGASGLMALTGLVDPADAEAQRKLDELRRVYQDALDNRASAGVQGAAPQP